MFDEIVCLYMALLSIYLSESEASLSSPLFFHILLEQHHSWRNSFSLDDMEMDGQGLKFDFDEFFRDIFQHSEGLRSQAESDHNSSAITDLSFSNSGLVDSGSSSNLMNRYMNNTKQPVSSCTLSFDESTVMPITKESPCPQLVSALTNTHSSPLSSSKRRRWNRNVEAKNMSRSSSETIHHIMTERKRRQDLAQKFIALSATIPGLKKMSKASVLREAINYVKQLQERVRELENEEKRTRSASVGGSMKNEEKQYSEVCSHCRSFEALPEMEAKVLGKQILIRFQCERQNDIMLKVMALLEGVHLSILSYSLLPFGNSAFSITIVAQMEDKYNMKIDDLLKYLKQDHQLLKSRDVSNGAC